MKKIILFFILFFSFASAGDCVVSAGVANLTCPSGSYVFSDPEVNNGSGLRAFYHAQSKGEYYGETQVPPDSRTSSCSTANIKKEFTDDYTFIRTYLQGSTFYTDYSYNYTYTKSYCKACTDPDTEYPPIPPNYYSAIEWGDGEDYSALCVSETNGTVQTKKEDCINSYRCIAKIDNCDENASEDENGTCIPAVPCDENATADITGKCIPNTPCDENATADIAGVCEPNEPCDENATADITGVCQPDEPCDENATADITGKCQPNIPCDENQTSDHLGKCQPDLDGDGIPDEDSGGDPDQCELDKKYCVSDQSPLPCDCNPPLVRVDRIALLTECIDDLQGYGETYVCSSPCAQNEYYSEFEMGCVSTDINETNDTRPTLTTCETNEIFCDSLPPKCVCGDGYTLITTMDLDSLNESLYKNFPNNISVCVDDNGESGANSFCVTTCPNGYVYDFLAFEKCTLPDVNETDGENNGTGQDNNSSNPDSNSTGNEFVDTILSYIQPVEKTFFKSISSCPNFGKISIDIEIPLAKNAKGEFDLDKYLTQDKLAPIKKIIFFFFALSAFVIIFKTT